jgi:hypothetical protein
MNDLTGKFAVAYDNYLEHARNMDPASIDDLRKITPLDMEMMMSRWVAQLDIKTRHELMKSSIEGIK